MARKVVKEGGSLKSAKNTYGKKIVKLSKAYDIGTKIAKQRNKGMLVPTKKLANAQETFIGMSRSDYPGIKPIQRKKIKALNSGYNDTVMKGKKDANGYRVDKYGNPIIKSKNTLGKKRAVKVASMSRINAVLGGKKTAKKIVKKTVKDNGRQMKKSAGNASKAAKVARKYM